MRCYFAVLLGSTLAITSVFAYPQSTDKYNLVERDVFNSRTVEPRGASEIPVAELITRNLVKEKAKHAQVANAHQLTQSGHIDQATLHAWNQQTEAAIAHNEAMEAHKCAAAAHNEACTKDNRAELGKAGAKANQLTKEANKKTIAAKKKTKELTMVTAPIASPAPAHLAPERHTA